MKPFVVSFFVFVGTEVPRIKILEKKIGEPERNQETRKRS